MPAASPSAPRFCRLLTLVFPILLLSASAAAQTVTGTIQGTVKDSGGGVLPGVAITITNADTGAERTVVTNEAGFFTAPFVQIGRYSVKAALSGFGTVLRENIEVGLNVTRVVDFSLEPRVTSEVTVTSELPRINSTKAEIKSSLTAEQIFERPTLNSSNFLEYPTTFPGFQENPTPGQNNPDLVIGLLDQLQQHRHARRDLPDQRRQQRRLLREPEPAGSGACDDPGIRCPEERVFGGVRPRRRRRRPRADEVGHQQAARGRRTCIGRTATGMRGPFSPPPTPQSPNGSARSTGFTAGFPIAQNRLFGFVNADVTKLDGENTYTRDLILPSDINVPWLTRGNDTPANRAFIQSVLDRYPSFMVPNDARSPRTYTGVAGINWPDYDYSGRADWNMSGGQTLTGRYQWTHQLRENEEVIVGEQTVQDNTQQNFGSTWTHILSNAIVGEFRYGLGRALHERQHPPGERHPDHSVRRPPVAGSGSIIGNAGKFPINRDQTDQQFVYNLTAQVFHNHSLRAGTDIRRQQLDDVADNFSRGFWSFTQQLRRHDLRDALRRVLRWLRQQLPEGLRPVLPREPDERGEPLPAGRLAPHQTP